MNIIPRLRLADFTSSRNWATAYLLVLCTQLVAIEGYGISPLKVGLMGLAPLVLLLKVPYTSKALVFGMLFWMTCYFDALLNGDMRVSSIGYLGMFVLAYITFYNLIKAGAFTFSYFSKLVKWLICAYGIILLLQQICFLTGIRSLWFINLDNQFFLGINKLPSLSIEPSHSARILAVAFLAYLRCYELARGGEKLTVKDLMSKGHRATVGLFLWTMTTMGSGTAFIGFGLLSLYFVTRKTAVYIIPLLIGMIALGNVMEIEQFDRAMRVARITTTGDKKDILEEDGSAAARVIPIVNTFKIDLTKKESWVGHGVAKKEAKAIWNAMNTKIGVVEQFGLLGLITSLLLIYSCAIRRFLSIETLLFLFLLGFSLGNIAYTWGALLLFTSVRHFQEVLVNDRGYYDKEDDLLFNH